jgi:hypothetical protein
VQFVPVDEPAGDEVADDGIVLPSVPEPADHLDRIGRLVEHIRSPDVAAPEEVGLVRGAADQDLPAGSTTRDEVKCGNGFRYVEWLGVGHGGDGDQTDVVRHRRHPGGDHHSVGSAREPTGLDFGATAPLRCERVVGGDEVEQSAFGGGGQPRPVPATRHGLEFRRMRPRLGMPAVAVERDRQVQLLTHGSVFANATG